jgi:hypothetical protein
VALLPVSGAVRVGVLLAARCRRRCGFVIHHWQLWPHQSHELCSWWLSGDPRKCAIVLPCMMHDCAFCGGLFKGQHGADLTVLMVEHMTVSACIEISDS